MEPNSDKIEDNPRRWFQYRLSTWFALVGIAAWAMAEWPWINSDEINRRTASYLNYEVTADSPPIANISAIGPILALAAFVGWKAACLIAERRRKRAATH